MEIPILNKSTIVRLLAEFNDDKVLAYALQPVAPEIFAAFIECMPQSQIEQVKKWTAEIDASDVNALWDAQERLLKILNDLVARGEVSLE